MCTLPRTLEQCLSDCPPSMLDRRIDSVTDLAEIARKLDEWKVIRPWLGLDKPDENAIEHDYQSTESRRFGLLEKWRERQGEAATYRALAKAFYDARRLDLVDEVVALASTMRRKSMQGSHPVLPSNLCVVLLVALVAVLVGLHCNGGILYSTIDNAYYMYYLEHSKSLPPLRTNFVGRDTEIQQLANLLDFSLKSYRIVSIYGPPGFGKSALAIHIGHHMVSQGVTVYYVNMDEVSSLQALAEKILTSDYNRAIPDISIARLDRWTRELSSKTLLILDNCDFMIQTKGGGDGNQDILQKQLQTFVDSTSNLKVLISSRKQVRQLDLYSYRLQELTPKTACELLHSELQHVTHSTINCSVITNLTGCVPLALRIVGTLLSEPDSPDPETVITQLQTHLMSTLSPNDLPIKERVNSSIAISYEYLSPQQQKVGRYLANFPGSFNTEHTCEIFSETFENCDCTCTTGHIQGLVRRSLLEHNTRTCRYQFHQLIKKFFLDVQDSIGGVGQKEVHRFTVSFHRHYSRLLHSLAGEFSEKDAAVLQVLDAERHSFQVLLLHFTSYAMCQERWSDCKVLVSAMKTGLEERFLLSRFTIHELYGPIERMVVYLERINPSEIATPDRVLLDVYVSLLVTLASFDRELWGTKKAVDTLKSRIPYIEYLDREIPGNGAATSYTEFYTELAEGYTLLQDHKNVLDCHSKLLRKAEELQVSSTRSNDYCDVGKVYYRIQKYENAVYFLKHCLDLEISSVLRGVFLSYILDSYKKIGDDGNSQVAQKALVELFPRLMKESVVTFQRKYIDVYTVINVYTSLGKWSEVRALAEKYINAVKQLGGEVTILDIRSAYKIAEMFYENGSYASAVDVAEFALSSLKRIPKETRNQENLTWFALVYLIAQAKYFGGNLSESGHYFTAIVEFMYDDYTSGGSLIYDDDTGGFLVWCFLMPLHTIKICSKVIFDQFITALKDTAVMVTNGLFDAESPPGEHHQETVTGPTIALPLTSIAIRYTAPTNEFKLQLQLLESLKAFIEECLTKLLLGIQWVLSYRIVCYLINFCWIIIKIIFFLLAVILSSCILIPIWVWLCLKVVCLPICLVTYILGKCYRLTQGFP